MLDNFYDFGDKFMENQEKILKFMSILRDCNCCSECYTKATLKISNI